MTEVQQTALRTARSLLDLGHSLDVVLGSPLIPAELHEFVREQIERDENFVLMPARAVVADRERRDWLTEIDRSEWHYWPTLRQYLLTAKGWDLAAVRALDDSSDRIVRQIAPPSEESFDVRGLVLGFVQSGKTANFTAVIAKAADAGYRLVIVLSGIDNGLRRQTNIRLKQELVGYTDPHRNAVRLPPLGKQWHEFTSEDLGGDFRPGLANHAALQGSQPVLLVVKKNGPVLRRLIRWLDDAPAEVRRTLPVLIVDDEADQASVDTRGTYQRDEDPEPEDYEEPSVINGLIRDVLMKFDRCSYIAYTATPFANILIPHDTVDPRAGNDLYPKDFIVDLPKPRGYFGAEEIFGRMDRGSGAQADGLNVIREVADEDIVVLGSGRLPASLEQAIVDFVLAGSARAQRGHATAPATMLIHTSQLVAVQARLTQLVSERFGELRDEWRYQREHGIRERLARRWDAEFRAVTREARPARDVEFVLVEPHITAFLESVQVREINSFTGEVLDYEREPSLKAIGVGGNRLSRGLTLEGLLISYFVRRSATYDTLMQMGRWFGFREEYEDLTRIWTTRELAEWFSDLAFVEHRLREDIAVYEDQGLTPLQVGMRIWQHPTMEVTSRLKRRFASTTTISQSYRLGLEQTFKFPLQRTTDLAVQAEANRLAVIELVQRLGAVDEGLTDAAGPIWSSVDSDEVLRFLAEYRVDEVARSISLPLISAYIERMNEVGELIRWTVAVRGLQRETRQLGSADWGLPGGPIPQVSRSRLGMSDSLGVITDPEDEGIGIIGRLRGREARTLRAAEEGLLLLYPISRHSGQGLAAGGIRRPIYAGSRSALARDLVGLAMSFPDSRMPQAVEAEAYIEGTTGWRRVE